LSLFLSTSVWFCISSWQLLLQILRTRNDKQRVLGKLMLPGLLLRRTRNHKEKKEKSTAEVLGFRVPERS
jgi:hypothetical protein